MSLLQRKCFIFCERVSSIHGDEHTQFPFDVIDFRKNDLFWKLSSSSSSLSAFTLTFLPPQAKRTQISWPANEFHVARSFFVSSVIGFKLEVLNVLGSWSWRNARHLVKVQKPKRKIESLRLQNNKHINIITDPMLYVRVLLDFALVNKSFMCNLAAATIPSKLALKVFLSVTVLSSFYRLRIFLEQRRELSMDLKANEREERPSTIFGKREREKFTWLFIASFLFIMHDISSLFSPLRSQRSQWNLRRFRFSANILCSSIAFRFRRSVGCLLSPFLRLDCLEMKNNFIFRFKTFSFTPSSSSLRQHMDDCCWLRLWRKKSTRNVDWNL